MEKKIKTPKEKVLDSLNALAKSILKNQAKYESLKKSKKWEVLSVVF